MRVVARSHALLDRGVGNSLSISIRQRIRVLLASPFLHNVAIVAGGTATAQIIAIAFSPIIARLYGPEAFGILGVFMAAFAMITPLSGLTYGVAIVLPASDDEARALLELSLMIGLVVTILSALVFGGFQVFLRALAGVDGITEVVVVPRYGQARAERLPPCLLQLPPAPGKAAYVRGVLAAAARHRPRFDLLFCGHINMAALAASVAFLLRRPWWLQIHGIDAWDPPPDRLTRAVVARADLVTAVSRHTRRRFLAWANNLEPHQVRVLPNVVDPRFTPGPKPAHLIQRYGLIGKRVLLTVGRLASAERYKGHDRVIAALAGLRPRFSDLVYVVVGNGDDRTRLKALAREFDAADRVLFLGEVPDEELVAHYRMADIFVMLSTGEGFGLVFLEAMASGVPAIGGDVDGSTDPLSCSPLGKVVPLEQLADAIAQMLENPPRHDQPRALVDRFGRAAFAVQLSGLTASFTPAGQRAPVLDRPIPSDLRSSRLRRRRSQASP